MKLDYKQDIKFWLILVKNKPKTFPQYIRREYGKFYEYIDENYDGNSFSQKIYNHIYEYKQAPSCKNCEQVSVSFLSFTRGYMDYCSRKCQARSPERKVKREKTCIKKYGVEHFSKTTEYKQKFKQTCMDRYGVENPGQIKENIENRARKKQLTFFNDKLANVWSEFSSPLFVFDDYEKVRDAYEWRCKKCRASFVSHVFNKIPKCPVCYPAGNTGGQSSIERDVIDYIRTIYSGEIKENDRQLLQPKEIDIFLPEYNLGIEICGLYWHSDDKIKNKYYHYDKFLQCESIGITLLTILDFEWNYTTNVIKDLIESYLTSTNSHVIIPGMRIDLRKGGLNTSSDYNFIEPKPWQTLKYELISNDDERFLINAPKFWDCGYREYY